MPDGNPGTGVGHNAKSRKDAINDALAQIFQLKSKEKAAVKAAVQPYRDKISDIKTTLREDYNLTDKVLRARLQSFVIEQEAIEAKDEVTLEALREMFKNAPVGVKIDMLTVLQAEDQNEIQDSLDTAKKKGTEAGANGVNFDTCPYPDGSTHARYWKDNWQAAQVKLAKTIKKTPAEDKPAKGAAKDKKADKADTAEKPTTH